MSELLEMMKKTARHVTLEHRGRNGAQRPLLTALRSLLPPQVREVIIDSVADYRATERAEWVLKWPGACLIAVSGIFWTAEVEEALTAKGNAGETRRRPPRPSPTPLSLPSHSSHAPPLHPLGAAEYFQKSHEQLMELTRIVSGRRAAATTTTATSSTPTVTSSSSSTATPPHPPPSSPLRRSPRCRRNLSAR